MKFTGYSDLLKIYLKYKLLIITFIINKITQMAEQNDPNYRQSAFYHNEILRLADSRIQRPVGGYELDWAITNRAVINGETQFSEMKGIKSLLQELIRQFNENRSIKFEGSLQQDFEKRLILIEHQLEGLLRKNINISQPSIRDGVRQMDYHQFLHEHEARVIELEKRIQNLLRRDQQPQAEIARLNGVIAHLQEEIKGKNQLIQRLQKPQQYGPNDQKRIEAEILNLPEISFVRRKYLRGEQWARQDAQYMEMVRKLDAASAIYISQISQLQRRYPAQRIQIDEKVLDILKSKDTRIVPSKDSNVITIEKSVTVTKTVQGNESNSRAILQALALHLNKLHAKYPKLKAEMNTNQQLMNLFNSEIIHLIDNGEMDSVVKIVEYVPHIVKVENVYAYSSQKSRKVEFHLRILLKALLEEIAKAKGRNPGLALEIDEGIIGMIQAEIMGTVNVDDILKVYRPVAKTEQVQKVMEKVVDRIVRVPEKIEVHSTTKTPVQVQRVKVVKDQVPAILTKQVFKTANRDVLVIRDNRQQKVVPHQIPHHMQVPVKEQVHVPFQVIVEKQRIVEKQVPVYVPPEKQIVIQKELQIKQVEKQVVKYIEKVIEVIKPVPFYVEKIVERVIEKEVPFPVEVIVEKIVKQIVYEKAPQMIPVVDTRVERVEVVREKIVPVQKIVPSVQVVTQYVEKIVEVQHRIQVPTIVQVEKEIVKIIREPQYVNVPQIQVQNKTVQVPKPVDRIVQVPLHVPSVQIEKQNHDVPIVHTQTREIHVPVAVQKFIPLVKEQVVEVLKSIPYIVKEEVPVMFKEEHKEFYQIIREVIKEVPSFREKIVEKLVQVPKTVEVQKIVEKVVVVPRIVQKIVTVPQYIEKIVEKQVQVPVMQPAKQIYIDRPVRVEVPVEVVHQKIVYIEKEVPKEIPANTIVVTNTQTFHTVETKDLIQERVVVNHVQVPRDIIVEKVVPSYVTQEKIKFVDKVLVHPVQVPVPIVYKENVIVQKQVTKERVVEVPMVAEKVVPVDHIVTQIQVVPQIEQKLVVEQKNLFHQIQKAYIQKEIQQVQRIREKHVVAYQREEKIKEVQKFTQKIVGSIVEIPKIIELTKPVFIQTPGKVEIVERVIPVLINVNQYIQKLVDKIVAVPHIIKQIQYLKDTRHVLSKPQRVQHTNIVQVNRDVPYEVIVEKEKRVIETINHVEQVLKTVTEVIQKDRDPVIITHDRIVEVPMVLEKIVEKIIVMPQVVEVLKYVHEVIENEELGLGHSASKQAKQYQELGVVLDKDFQAFLGELRHYKNQPNHAERIRLIEDYLMRFRRFIRFPKIYEIIKEVKVPEEKTVILPGVQTAEQRRAALLKVLLNDKLIKQIRKLKQNYKIPDSAIDQDLAFILGYQFGGKAKDAGLGLDELINRHEQQLRRSFKIDWNSDYGEMVRSLFEERMFLTDLNNRYIQELTHIKKQQSDAQIKLKERDYIIQTMFKTADQHKRIMAQVKTALSNSPQNRKILDSYNLITQVYDNTVLSILNNLKEERYVPVEYLNKKFIDDIVNGVLHEKNQQIRLLRLKLRNGDVGHCNAIIGQLTNIIFRMKGHLDYRGGASQSQRIASLQTQISRLNEIISRYGQGSGTDDSEWRRKYIQLDRIHSQCINVGQVARMKGDISRLTLQNSRLREEITSPRNSLGGNNRTVNSIVSPIQQADYRSDSDTGAYGENYQEYVQADEQNAGYINRGELGSNSNYSRGQQGKGMTSSSYSYSNKGYQQVINSPTGSRGQIQQSYVISNSAGSSNNLQRSANVLSSNAQSPFNAGQVQRLSYEQRGSQSQTPGMIQQSYTTTYTSGQQGVYQERTVTQTGLSGEIKKTNYYEQKYSKRQ